MRFDEISGPPSPTLGCACIDSIVQFGKFQITRVFTLLEEAIGLKGRAVFADPSYAGDQVSPVRALQTSLRSASCQQQVTRRAFWQHKRDKSLRLSIQQG
jgi:hypothetical protein